MTDRANLYVVCEGVSDSVSDTLVRKSQASKKRITERLEKASNK